ncbi:hypothetical protein J2T38_000864 [Neisseria perflava]|uniref:hypothetical protein n=1 Tax=Neisseria perflava TaxID=33053 RepID=UPI0020A155DF|nr:hypothetical protein [Neisseria perflava]MCP1772050.1 hypothetical protein [Neisseria perflava]
MFTTSLKSAIGLGLAGITAATSLSGCMISDDPAVNTIATVAAVGTVASLIYSVSDGYYYDNSYNRMPRGYRPGNDVQIVRVNNINHVRQEYPRGWQGHMGGNQQRPQMQQGRMQQQGQRPQQPGQMNGQRPQMQPGQQGQQRPQMQQGQQRPQQMQQQRQNVQQRGQQQQRRLPNNNGNNPFERNN